MVLYCNAGSRVEFIQVFFKKYKVMEVILFMPTVITHSLCHFCLYLVPFCGPVYATFPFHYPASSKSSGGMSIFPLSNLVLAPL